VDISGDTPLHICANLYNSAALIEALIAGGADKTCKNKKSQTPKEVAEAVAKKYSQDRKEIINLLD